MPATCSSSRQRPAWAHLCSTYQPPWLSHDSRFPEGSVSHCPEKSSCFQMDSERRWLNNHVHSWMKTTCSGASPGALLLAQRNPSRLEFQAGWSCKRISGSVQTSFWLEESFPLKPKTHPEHREPTSCPDEVFRAMYFWTWSLRCPTPERCLRQVFAAVLNHSECFPFHVNQMLRGLS